MFPLTQTGQNPADAKHFGAFLETARAVEGFGMVSLAG
jgi:hypothetical protein